MHLLLHHGPDIVRIFPCGAGLMSEEPSEAVVKYFRHFRSHHASKHPSKNLEHVFLRQAHLADPVIQNLLWKKLPGQQKTPLSPKAQGLLAPLESYDYLVPNPRLPTIEEEDEPSEDMDWE